MKQALTASLFIASLLLSGTVRADQHGAAACAARLNPRALLVYNATAPEIHNGQPLRRLIQIKTITLVENGQLRRTSARPAAMAAYECLRRLN